MSSEGERNQAELERDAKIFASLVGRTVLSVERVAKNGKYDSDADEVTVVFTDGTKLVFLSSDGSGYRSEINIDHKNTSVEKTSV